MEPFLEQRSIEPDERQNTFPLKTCMIAYDCGGDYSCFVHQVCVDMARVFSVMLSFPIRSATLWSFMRAQNLGESHAKVSYLFYSDALYVSVPLGSGVLLLGS